MNKVREEAMPVSGGRVFQAEGMARIKGSALGHLKRTQGGDGLHHKPGKLGGTVRMTTVDSFTGTVSCYFIMAVNHFNCSICATIKKKKTC